MRTSPCKYCGQLIGFIETSKKGWMPVEPELVDAEDLDDDENTLITEDGETLKNPGKHECGYRPHWGNCSGADEARRR